MGWKIRDVFMMDTGKWLGTEFWPSQISKIIERLQAVAGAQHSYMLCTDVGLAAVLDTELDYVHDIFVYAVPCVSFSVVLKDMRNGTKWHASQVSHTCKVQDVIPTSVLEDVISRKVALRNRLNLSDKSSLSPHELPICLHSELSSDTTIVVDEWHETWTHQSRQ